MQTLSAATHAASRTAADPLAPPFSTTRTDGGSNRNSTTKCLALLGVDPLIRREFRNLVHEAVAGGAMVLLSSHVMSEVELICNWIALIRDRRLHLGRLPQRPAGAAAAPR